MSEWWTYDISNFLLFSPRTYDRMLESYNAAVQPWQVAAVMSGLTILALAARRGNRRESWIRAALLAMAWIVVAWAFHLERYASINWSARWFAVASGVEAVMILVTEAMSKRDARATSLLVRVGGLALAGFAIALLPIVQKLLGRPWMQVEVFGLFPDATALGTLGLVIAGNRLDWHLFVIPFASCLVGAATLAALQRPDAVVVLGGAVATLMLMCWKTVLARRAKREAALVERP